MPSLILRLGIFLVLITAGCTGAGRVAGEADLSGPPAQGKDYPWVYLRDDQPLKEAESLAQVLAVGDVMLGRGVRAEKDPLGEVAPWLKSAGLALGNLECAISADDEAGNIVQGIATPGQPYRLLAPPSSVELLSQAGFDLLGMANNHALDGGLEGLAETGAALEKAGLRPLGAGPGPGQAYEAVIRQVNGIKLAFLAFNAVPSPRGPEWSGEVRQSGPQAGWSLAGWDRDKALAAVRSTRLQSDGVIVSIHWGYEYETRVDPAQREIARDLASAGASLVVGHHPHVVQAVDRLPGVNGSGETLVAYSLGNFVFDQGFGETGQGLALRAYFDRQGLRAVQALPVSAGPRPKLMPPDQVGKLLNRITPQVEHLAWSCDGKTCTPVQAPQSFRGGQFTRGESDLSGDGLPEQVTLEAGRVHIEGPGLPVWDSPAEWRVVDLAQGDPNQDGRQELLLALQKPDRSGVLLSHPFILGYREGEWRVLWGGSAVSDPILEVELGDLNGDGAQELAVLEELHTGAGQALSIWRWNGWGFSQVWRSQAGSYSRLGLFDDGSGTLLVTDKRPE